MNKQHAKRCGIIVGIVLVAFLMWNMVYGIKIYEILAALILLERGKEPIITLSRKNLFFIMKRSNTLKPLKDKMKGMGWTFVARYGQAFVFTKEGAEVILMRKEVCRYTLFVLESVFREEANLS